MIGRQQPAGGVCRRGGPGFGRRARGRSRPRGGPGDARPRIRRAQSGRTARIAGGRAGFRSGRLDARCWGAKSFPVPVCMVGVERRRTRRRPAVRVRAAAKTPRRIERRRSRGRSLSMTKQGLATSLQDCVSGGGPGGPARGQSSGSTMRATSRCATAAATSGSAAMPGLGAAKPGAEAAGASRNGS